MNPATLAAWAAVGTAAVSLQVGLFQIARRVDRWRDTVTENLDGLRHELREHRASTARAFADMPVREQETRRRFVRLERHVGLSAWHSEDLAVALRHREREEGDL